MEKKPVRTLRVLGIRGLPAAHGGFETFAEHLSLYLVSHGWRVVVYCQDEGKGDIHVDHWRGVERVRIPIETSGAKGTMLFDWKAIAHAARECDLCLTLGYNTASFCAALRLRGVPNIINMDGIEWARAKWGRLAKFWFWMNDWAGCWLADHLIADHPEIARLLSTRASPKKIATIGYGAPEVAKASTAPVKALGLEPGEYMTVIARAEPENSIATIVDGFSRRPRGVKLAVLGNYVKGYPYHDEVKRRAGPEVVFLGAIYDPATVQALRFHSLAYVHGHQIGGTNPSLVEALGAGNPVIAHDNRFNRGVVADGADYFNDEASFDRVLGRLLADRPALARLGIANRRRHREAYTWPMVLGQYESLLIKHLPRSSASASSPALSSAPRREPAINNFTRDEAA